MTKIGDLIQTAADVTALPASKVKEKARQVREAGYMQTGSAGRYGGADMTERDAANLLLGLTCTEYTADAGAAVHRYHGLVIDFADVWTEEIHEPIPDRPNMVRKTLKNLCPKPMQWLGVTSRGLLLGDTLERLIGMARTGEIQAIFRELVISQNFHEDAIDRVINELGAVYLKLEFRRPRPGANIMFGMRGERPFVSASFGHRSELETSEELDRLQVGHFVTTTTIPHQVIFALGEALRD
jgi:hypothetical protein